MTLTWRTISVRPYFWGGRERANTDVMGEKDGLLRTTSLERRRRPADHGRAVQVDPMKPR